MKHEIDSGLEKLRNHAKFQIDLSSHATNFIKKLESGARFRYYETSYFSEEMDLPHLDRTVWELRRYCQPLDYELEANGNTTNQLTINLDRIRAALAANDKGSCISNGWLEEVISKPKHYSREALVWRNLYFGSGTRKSIKINEYHEGGNSPLFLHPEIIDEVAKFIYLPEEVKTAYRELHNKRLADKGDA